MGTIFLLHPIHVIGWFTMQGRRIIFRSSFLRLGFQRKPMVETGPVTTPVMAFVTAPVRVVSSCALCASQRRLNARPAANHQSPLMSFFFIPIFFYFGFCLLPRFSNDSRFFWNLLGIIGYYCILLAITGYYWVWRGFIRFDSIFSGLSLIFAYYYWIGLKMFSLTLAFASSQDFPTIAMFFGELIGYFCLLLYFTGYDWLLLGLKRLHWVWLDF